MKINEIITEDLNKAQVGIMFADNPRLLDFINQAYQSPAVDDWGDAIDVGSAKYAEWVRKRDSQRSDTAGAGDQKREPRQAALGDRKSKRKQADDSKTSKDSKPKSKLNAFPDNWDELSPLQKLKYSATTGFDVGKRFANFNIK